jgi:enoyl-CoA hydratase
MLLRGQLQSLFEAHGGMEFMTVFSDDHREAVHAFKEKRKPRFTGH